MTAPAHLDSGLRPRVAAPASPPIYEEWPLGDDDDRIMIDIKTEMAIRSQMQSNTNKTGWIPHFLLEGSTLGPLLVLIILGIYLLFSPMLPPAFHEYVYRILH